ncbi:BLOC-1 related complex subunit 6 [Astyanax mexicanus]|uniref:BLOC-1 related complex subunit 6 n=1 Tax=Astyanax mexicanus TaxID=7994 RepID=UPI0020CAFC19|nr:BLOC-1 related complex subunit 6 [Astyanax mexicanus]XP_022521823.2 BLOC-1 related complex subunit 6 [Astyanax mexicanus]
MSHSPGIGHDLQEATNGVDWMSTHGSTSLKYRDGGACPEQDSQDGTVAETDGHTPHTPHTPHTTESVCRQTDKHSDKPHTNTHTPDQDPPHTPHSQPASKHCSDSADPDHTHTNDGWRGVEEEEDGGEDEDEPVKETTTENPPTSEAPPTEPPSRTASEDDAPSSSSTPPEQAPPLVPAPPPGSDPAPVVSEADAWQRPVHVMAEVRVHSAPERERVVRGMQDSKSLDGISNAYGGGPRGSGAKGGQAEGRRATISSALELEGTVSHDGDLTHFITKNLEQKIKMSSRPSLDTDCESDCSGPVVRGRGSSRRPADIPPIDPSVLLDLHKHTQEVAQSVEMMLRSLNGTIQNMTALSVGYIQTYRDSVDSLGESVDMSIKGMYTLMARCEELDRSMQPIQALAAQIRDIKRTLDTLEAICK